MLTTTKFGFPYPNQTDADNVPVHMKLLADALDLRVLKYSSGTHANISSSLLKGTLYWATDTNELFFCPKDSWLFRLTGALQPACARYWNGAYFYGSAPAFVAIAWDYTVFARNGMATIAAGTKKLIVPVTGYYRVHAQVAQSVYASDPRTTCVQIRKGPNSDTAGTVIAQGFKANTVTASGRNAVDVQTTISLTAGDDIAIWMASTLNSVLRTNAGETFVNLELASL